MGDQQPQCPCCDHSSVRRSIRYTPTPDAAEVCGDNEYNNCNHVVHDGC